MNETIRKQISKLNESQILNSANCIMKENMVNSIGYARDSIIAKITVLQIDLAILEEAEHIQDMHDMEMID